MTTRSYLQLPINADDGFPQAFRLSFLEHTYQIALYVNALAGAATLPADYLYQLPAPDAFLVMTVQREDAAGPVVIFRRKVLCDLEYEAAELAFLFRTMTVAKRNLNGIGAYGSQIVGGIAAR